jgi:hypothetical protein
MSRKPALSAGFFFWPANIAIVYLKSAGITARARLQRLFSAPNERAPAKTPSRRKFSPVIAHYFDVAISVD